MNIQTERLEDSHAARLTVEIEAHHLEGAMQKAAQKISRSVNIPGFRKGKAPYKIVLRYVGQAAVLEQAVEDLSTDIYPQIIKESGLDPYGPGEVEGFEVEPALTFKYIVQLQPTVDLGAYRDIRLPFEPPQVSDEDVNKALLTLQEQHAVIEESSRPVELGNRVTVDVDSYFVTGEDDESDAEADSEAEAEHDHDHEHDHEHSADDPIHQHHHSQEDTFMHEHDAPIILTPEREPIAGFSAALVGASVGDVLHFTLDAPPAEKGEADEGEDEVPLPEDLEADVEDEEEDLKIKFVVVVKKIEVMTLPALTDDFAARVTKDEEKPLTLLQLRMRMRENLQRMADERYTNDYARAAVDQIVTIATIKYPELMAQEQTDTFLNYLDQNLRQQGITLQDYMKIYRRTLDDLRAQYRDVALQAMKRSLVMREIARAEALTVPQAAMDQRVNELISQFGDASQQGVRDLFNTPDMRERIANDLLQEAVFDRVTEIAKGMAPALETPASEPTETAE